MDTPASQKDQMQYEETPPIEPIKEPDVSMFPPPKPSSNAGSIVTVIIVFILLFIVGFWFSGSIRQYVGTFLGKGAVEPTVTLVPTPNISSLVPIPTIEATPAGVWKSYQALNGRTRMAYNGLVIQLPPEVLPPICDGSACGSQGTYLPNGTRFTIALRGTGQVLPDFRGKVISDLGGIPFPLTDAVVDGIAATEYSGTFIGKTVGGYVFTRMRGYMIPITEGVSFEINHFSPSGIVSDFAKDDLVFNEIIQKLQISSGVSEKGGTPFVTPTINAATSSTIPTTGF